MSGEPVEGSYAPGDRVVVAAGDVWLFAEIDPAHEAVGRWWSSIRDGASVAGVLEQVLDEGFRTVPSFAIAGYDERAGSGSVMLRGDVYARLSSEGGDDEHRAEPGQPWREVPIDESVTRVEIGVPERERSGVLLPLNSGVTIASAIQIDLRATDASDATGLNDALAPAASPLAAVSPPAVETPIETPIEAPIETPIESRVVVPVVEDAAPTTSAVAPTAEATDLPASSPAERDGPEPPAFDFLFGATQQRPAEERVSWTADQTAAGAEEPTATTPAVSSAVPAATLQPGDTLYPAPADRAAEPAPSAEDASDGLISALPWQLDQDWRAPAPPAAAAPAPAPPLSPSTSTPAVPPATDTDPATVNRAALLAQAAAAQHLGPTVKAVQCPSGHLSPPQLESCRVCSAPLSAQSAFTAPRPVLGSIRLSTGDVVTLDRNVVMGRSPESHAADNAADRPHVVKLASPEQDISRNHLEIRLEDWHVLIVDLDSVNGTVVTLPDRDPQRLRPNDAVAIEPGTVVTLADEVSFVYEVGA